MMWNLERGGRHMQFKKTLANSMEKHNSLYILNQAPFQRYCWIVKGKTDYIMT